MYAEPYNWLLPCLYVVAFLTPRFCVLHRLLPYLRLLAFMGTSVRSEGEKLPSEPPPSPELGHLPHQIPPLEEIFLVYCPAQASRTSPPTSHRESQTIPVASGSEEASDTLGADNPPGTPNTPLSESSLLSHPQNLPLEDLDAAISNLGRITDNRTGFDNQNVEDASIASEEERETTSPVPSDFILVLENGRQYSQYGQFSGWLHRIMLRTASPDKSELPKGSSKTQCNL
jgi:hypothetical protein